MINVEYVKEVAKSIKSLEDHIQIDLKDYISMDIPVDDAILMKMKINNIRSDLYGIIKECDDSDAQTLVYTTGDDWPVETIIQRNIALTTSMIAMLDRYIAECYATKVEKLHNSNLVSVGLEYCTRFEDLKIKKPEDKKPAKFNPRFIKSTVYVKEDKS